MQARTYLCCFAATVAGLAALATALTVVVDPYRMYGTKEILGWTALKPQIYDRVGIAKTYSLDRTAPRTLLLGNSRVEIGLDPASAQWPADDRPVFNAAEAGRDMFTALRMLQHAAALRPPNLVVVGLDILDFLQKPDAGENRTRPSSRDELRLSIDRDGQPNPRRALQIWRDRLATTLTIDAFVDSLATLFDQDPSSTVTMTVAGFNPLHEYRTYVARSGYHEIFRQKNAIYERQYRQYFAPDFGEPNRYASLRDLRRLIQVAASRKCRLVLFIHPYHSDYLEMLHSLDFWPSFEAWKRALVRLVEEEAEASGISIDLVDFSGYDEFTTEPVPPADDLHSEMRWYWESGHYKRELGEKMLMRLITGKGGFGRKLTSGNIDDVLASIRASRAKFSAQISERLDPLQTSPKLN
jgi:hypothetical protein